VVEETPKCNGNVSLRLDVNKANRLSKVSLTNATNEAIVESGNNEIVSRPTSALEQYCAALEPTSPDSSLLQTPPPPPLFVINSNQVHHQSHSNLSHGLRNVTQHHRPPMYKSHGNLHNQPSTGIVRQEPSLLSAPAAPLDNILLYSTSLTSINFCADTYAKSTEAHAHSRRTSSTVVSADPATPACDANNNDRSRRQSLIGCNVSSNQLTTVVSPSTMTSAPNTGTSNVTSSHAPSTTAANHSSSQNTCSTLRALLSFSLLREQLFVWFALSNFLTSLG
jgi:hypothetical protein